MQLSTKWILFLVILTVLAGVFEAQTAPDGVARSLKQTAAGQSARSGANGGTVLTASSFGFQCGTGKLTNCPNASWPMTIAQPGMIRLWDSQVQWHLLNPGAGVYDWGTLDKYLDAIAAHQPRSAMYTFGYTPCWDTRAKCEVGWGSTYPPSDLSKNGSPSFNLFVTALVDHCSQAHHCVKDYIKYWEMWNEANAPSFWNGTVEQLYSLMAPAIPIIRNHIPGAIVLSPPANRGDTDWMKNWLNEENSRGRLSDIFSFHLYLQNKLPEFRFDTVKEMINLKNNTSGWRDVPWLNSESNFDAATFSCATRYDADDCAGQIVRWHLLHFSYGARQLSWYYFNTTIGHNTQFSNTYHTMMDWLVGGHFTGECSAAGAVVTCPFVEANGHSAIFVWNVPGDAAYTPADQYSDYKTLDGATTAISRGQRIPISVKPIMLESGH